MGLNVALADRARPIEKRAAGERVEGTTLFAETRGAWFRCRLTLPATPEVAAAAAGVREVVREPQLMYGVADLDGGVVALTNGLRLEVSSAQLGSGVWEVVGEPEPYRKRRRVIGHEVTLRRVDTHPADEVV